MLNYIFKRIVIGIVTLWFIVTCTFFLMHSIPGGPFDSDSLENFPMAVQQSLMKNYGLDQPIIVQYGKYMSNLVRGDLGVSITYTPRKVVDVISKEMPITGRLALASVIVTAILGVAWGTFAALYQGKWQDNVARVLTILGITIPGFVIATLLIYQLSVRWNLLPAMGVKSWKGYIMPVIALSLTSIAYLSRLTRSSFLDIFRQDYMRTARAKGLPSHIVIFKHGLRSCLIPIVTYLGPMIGAMLMGSFVVETIFAIPGMGREMVLSINNRDYVMIPALTGLYSLILISVGILVDILYVVIDPRVAFEAKKEVKYEQ